MGGWGFVGVACGVWVTLGSMWRCNCFALLCRQALGIINDECLLVSSRLAREGRSLQVASTGIHAHLWSASDEYERYFDG